MKAFRISTNIRTLTRIFCTFFVTFLLACTQTSTQKSNPDIDAGDLEAHITFLASDELEGREAGSAGEAIAAAYIADLFEKYGLEPSGDDNTYLQEFIINTSLLKNPHSEGGRSGEKLLAHNVIGTIYGTGNEEEFIVIGAHYDHLGWGDGGYGSLYRGDSLMIHNGADDNASGTAGLLELAEYFSQYKPSKDIVFIAFSGEEMGLLGSEHYVSHPTADLSKALAMINMDMIGRMEDNTLIIYGLGTADDWIEIVNDANTENLHLTLVSDGPGPSDHTSFYYKDIPVLHYFTDAHEDYHKPTDDVEFINFEGTVSVLNHVKRVVETLDGSSKSQLVFREAAGNQNRTTTVEGPTLGVVPDYGYSEGDGMKITGVNKGGPADKAGLKSGDIITKIGNASLKDIYDYMGALNALKKGQITSVTVLRDGKEVTVELDL